MRLVIFHIFFTVLSFSMGMILQTDGINRLSVNKNSKDIFNICMFYFAFILCIAFSCL
jgi:hypothetical protein